MIVLDFKNFDLSSVISLLISILTLIYTIFSNKKKYELTYQYYNDVLTWHNQTVDILIALKLFEGNYSQKNELLAQLSAKIEAGRFYFPNIDRKDNFGKEKPLAYQGYRNVVLDFLVYQYQLFQRDDYKMYLRHAEELQKQFTSYIFQYLQPSKHRKKVGENTTIDVQFNFTIEDFLKQKPESIKKFLDLKVH